MSASELLLLPDGSALEWEVETETAELTRHVPDESWVWTDDRGHVHAWHEGGVPSTEWVVATCGAVPDDEHECYRVCKYCGVEVRPRTRVKTETQRYNVSERFTLVYTAVGGPEVFDLEGVTEVEVSEGRCSAVVRLPLSREEALGVKRRAYGEGAVG